MRWDASRRWLLMLLKASIERLDPAPATPEALPVEVVKAEARQIASGFDAKMLSNIGLTSIIRVFKDFGVDERTNVAVLTFTKIPNSDVEFFGFAATLTTEDLRDRMLSWVHPPPTPPATRSVH